MKVLTLVDEPCEHPASGLLVTPGEMELSADQAEALISARLAIAAEVPPEE